MLRLSSPWTCAVGHVANRGPFGERQPTVFLVWAVFLKKLPRAYPLPRSGQYRSPKNYSSPLSVDGCGVPFFEKKKPFRERQLTGFLVWGRVLKKLPRAYTLPRTGQYRFPKNYSSPLSVDGCGVPFFEKKNPFRERQLTSFLVWGRVLKKLPRAYTSQKLFRVSFPWTCAVGHFSKEKSRSSSLYFTAEWSL